MGEHLRFWTDGDEDAVCGGTFRYLDGYIGELKRIHGVSDDLVVDYHWFSNEPERIEDLCSPGFDACTKESTVFAPYLPHEHETVHAVRFGLGNSHPFFEEGAAELWGLAPIDRFPVNLDIVAGISASKGADRLPLEFYRVAGRFSSWLAKVYGESLIVEIAERTDFDDAQSYDHLDALFDDLTGQSLASAIEAYEADDWGCSRLEYRDDGPNCSLARKLDCADADEAGDVEFTVDLSCDSPEAIGPRANVVWAELTFEQPRDGSYPVVIFGDDSAANTTFSDYVHVVVTPCGPGCPGTAHYDVSPDVIQAPTTGAGRYLIRVTRRLDSPTAAYTRVNGKVYGICE